MDFSNDDWQVEEFVSSRAGSGERRSMMEALMVSMQEETDHEMKVSSRGNDDDDDDDNDDDDDDEGEESGEEDEVQQDEPGDGVPGTQLHDHDGPAGSG